jgi:hypothetical protein
VHVPLHNGKHFGEARVIQLTATAIGFRAQIVPPMHAIVAAGAKFRGLISHNCPRISHMFGFARRKSKKAKKANLVTPPRLLCDPA